MVDKQAEHSTRRCTQFIKTGGPLIVNDIYKRRVSSRVPEEPHAAISRETSLCLEDN